MTFFWKSAEYLEYTLIFYLNLYLTETAFNAFCRQSRLQSGSSYKTGSILFAYGNMILSDHAQIDLTSNLFVLRSTLKFIDILIQCRRGLADQAAPTKQGIFCLLKEI